MLERGITIAAIFLQMSLEEAIGYVAFDELIEVRTIIKIHKKDKVFGLHSRKK